MNAVKTVVIASMLSASLFQSSHAQDKDHYLDQARVTEARPIYQTVEYQQPREACWEETVSHGRRGGNDANPGLIIGGIVGGAVGNRFGRGDGKTAMTAIGAIAGAAIGQEMGRKPDRRHPHTQVVRRCGEIMETYTEERIVGYVVHYRYRGHDFTTRMDHDPGPTLPVEVSIRPRY